MIPDGSVRIQQFTIGIAEFHEVIDEIADEHQYVVVATPVDGIVVVDSNDRVVLGMIRECQ